jgi:hypothetical protein
MLSMMNASPRTSRDLHAAGSAAAAGAAAADAYANPAFSSSGSGSDQENYAHDAQAFALRPQQQTPQQQVSVVKGGDTARTNRPEPRAIAVRGLAHSSGSASSSTSTGRSAGGAQSKQTANAPRREKRSTKSKCSPGLRSGKWTPEEEAFTNTIIHYFKRGLLDIEDGTSLRWYLAKRLNCEAMRVTKKLKGNSSIGKQIFRALENSPENRMAILHAKDELAVLEKHFLESLTAIQPPSLIKPSANNSIRLIGPDGESLQDDANLLLHFFVGAHDAVDPVDGVTKPSGAKTTAGPSNMNLNVEFKLDKKRPFSSMSPSSNPPTTTAHSELVPSPSKRRSVKIEDLMD